ncbi:hypothetical protein [Sphingomonas sp.]|uniref:hypothetical protein n=1 Tax=Sphingomonas sp. TaxID=28214 RepID=UPI003B3A9503
MPFTPFHLGPGAVFKAIGRDRFSFLMFGGTQILMDVEPLVHILRGDRVLHGTSHTIAGALAIAGVSILLAVPIIRWLMRHLTNAPPLTWTVATISALVGTYSHILLDAIMHSDMNPLWPFAPGNSLQGIISVDGLHLFCMSCGLIGGAAIALRAMRRS